MGDAPQQAAETAIALTEARDGETLTGELVLAISAFPGVDLVTPFEAFPSRPVGAGSRADRSRFVFRTVACGLPLHRASPDLSGLAESMAEARECSVTRRCGGARLVFPVVGDCGPNRVVAVDHDGRLDGEARAWMRYALQLYSNQLFLIDAMERDRLTGLFNRHSLQERFGQIHPSDGKTSWLALVDVDHFKAVNDEHGHLVGDDVLRHFAQLIRREFRYSDLAFRFGGDEFIVLVRGVSEEEARCALERFRASVEGFDFPTVGRVATSIGFARVEPRPGLNGVVEAADRALYRAKREGGNQVCAGRADPRGTVDAGTDSEASGA